MTRHRWRTELKSCASEVEVLKVVERFLGEWTAEELRQLPVAPATFTSGRAVSDFTFLLGHAHSKYDGPNESLLLLQEMLLFFTQASVRVAQLRASEGPPGVVPRAVAEKPVPDEA